MALDQKVYVVADGTPDGLHDGQGVAQILVLHVHIRLAEGVPLQSGDTLFLCGHSGGGKFVRGLGTGEPDVGVHTDAVADLAAQHFIDGHIAGLGLDVPQSHVHSGNGTLQHGTHTPVGIPVQLMADPLHLTGILADEDTLDILDGTQQSVLLVFQGALTDAGNARIGFDLHEHKVGPEGKDIKGFDIRNFHCRSSIKS